MELICKTYRQVDGEKLDINILLYIYLFFISFIILNDYITYIYGHESTLGTYNLSLIICICIWILIKQGKLINFTPVSFHRFDIFVFLILAIVFSIRIAIPDNNFDTLNYHLILQQNPFADYINYHFFPGRNLNSFSYPLGDRMFFVFRSILGYRLGILLNAVVIVVIYYVTKDFLLALIPNKGNKYYKLIISTIAFLGIASEKIYEIINTYLIDILFIPLFIELVRIILFEIDLCNRRPTYIYIGLLSGIIVSFKITNIVFISVLIILFLFKNHKKFNLKYFIGMILSGIIPCLVYTINIYAQTGSPIFPFYNSIFKSQYFMNINWLDNRYGPKSIVETLLWPFIIFTSPSRTSDNAVYCGRLTIGYVVSILWLTLFLLKAKMIKTSKLIINFIVVFLVFILLWALTMVGFVRYGLLLEIFSGVIVGSFLYHLLSIENKSICIKGISFFISITILINITLTSKEIFFNNAVGWWRNPIYADINQHKENFKYLFVDRFAGIDKNEVKDIQAWGICNFNSGYGRLINPDIPMISLNSGVANELTSSIFNNCLMKYKNIYTIIEGDHMNEAIERLNGTDYVLGNKVIKVKPYFINQQYSLYLCEITAKPNSSDKNSIINIILGQNVHKIDLSELGSNMVEFKALVALNPIAESWGSDGFNIDFFITSPNMENQKVHSEKIDSNAEFKEVSFIIDLSKYQEKVQDLEIALSNDTGNNANADWASIINPKITLVK